MNKGKAAQQYHSSSLQLAERVSEIFRLDPAVRDVVGHHQRQTSNNGAPESTHLRELATMPMIPLRSPAVNRDGKAASRVLPPLLHTPSGLAILELQGSVLAEHGDVQGSTAALPLGKLLFPSADGQDSMNGGDWDGKRVFLFVGKHQRMTGEVKKLAKPLAIVRRSGPGASADDDAATGDDLEITEVAYFKILFAHRPEPMGGEQEDVVLEE